MWDNFLILKTLNTTLRFNLQYENHFPIYFFTFRHCETLRNVELFLFCGCLLQSNQCANIAVVSTDNVLNAMATGNYTTRSKNFYLFQNRFNKKLHLIQHPSNRQTVTTQLSESNWISTYIAFKENSAKQEPKCFQCNWLFVTDCIRVVIACLAYPLRFLPFKS